MTKVYSFFLNIWQEYSPDSSFNVSVNDETVDLISRVADLQQEKWQLEERVRDVAFQVLFFSLFLYPRKATRSARRGERNSDGSSKRELTVIIFCHST